MENFLEKLLTDIFKGIIYSIMTGVVGFFASFVLGWPLLKGVYVAILIGGVTIMILSVIFIIGIPKDRFEFLFKGKIVNGTIEKLGDEKNKDFSYKGISPAIISVVMIGIGLLIEALMH